MNEKDEADGSSPQIKILKIEMKSEYMSSTHSYWFSLCLVIATCITFVLSTFSKEMLLYDDSEVYSCPKDHYYTTNANLGIEKDTISRNEVKEEDS